MAHKGEQHPKELKTQKSFMAHYAAAVKSMPPHIYAAYIGRKGRKMCFDFFTAHTAQDSSLFDEIEAYMDKVGYDYLYCSQSMMGEWSIFNPDAAFDSEQKLKNWEQTEFGDQLFIELNLATDQSTDPRSFDGCNKVEKGILRRRSEDRTIVFFHEVDLPTVMRLLAENRLDLLMGYYDCRPENYEYD